VDEPLPSGPVEQSDGGAVGYGGMLGGFGFPDALRRAYRRTLCPIGLVVRAPGASPSSRTWSSAPEIVVGEAPNLDGKCRSVH